MDFFVLIKKNTYIRSADKKSREYDRITISGTKQNPSFSQIDLSIAGNGDTVDWFVSYWDFEILKF